MSFAHPSKDEIFNTAAELADDQQRQAYLAEVCQGDSNLRREIEQLLDQDRAAGSFLETPPTGLDAPVSGPLLEKSGTQIGPYTLLERIGQGGMGVVYLAEQTTPVRRRVALKIIKPGMDTQQVIKRFEAERQALALMDHPNIAKVLDAGATETGRPYFVMEWVKGLPITRYCDEHQLNPRQRLELFATVCQAVQHSHQKGIIHRDIKPSNVLVSESDGRPVAKVIDFGLAKAIGPQLIDKTVFTQQGQIIGTVEYMSPEQADLNPVDVDTRTDIYSLGVLLYELLTGETPFDRTRLRSAAYIEILRIIREEEPPRPSMKLSSSEALPSIAANRHCEPKKLSTLVRGELDWIVMKAMEKDRSRRYETANGFARDISRYLNDEPAVACPPSTAYRFRKFARRNRTAITATAATLLCLIAGIIGTSWQAIRATSEAHRATIAEELAEQRLEAEQQARRATQEARAVAQMEAEHANAVVDLIEEMLASADPENRRGKEYSVRELLDDFSEGLSNQLSDQPEVEAAIRALIGRAYYRIAPEKAEPHLKAALDLRRRVLDAADERIADSLLDYAWCRWEDNDADTAERYSREALAMYQAVTEAPEPIIAALRLLQLSLESQGRDAEAEQVAREAIQLADRSGPIETADLASILHRLGSSERTRGNLAEAEALGLRAVAVHRRTNGDQHPETAWGLCNLSGSSESLGKLAEAARYRQEALQIFRLNYLDDHKSIRLLLPGLTGALLARNDHDAAEQVWRETVEVRRHQFGSEHSLTAEALSQLGKVLELSGDRSAAEAQHREALSIWKRLAEQEPGNALLHCQMADHFAQQLQYDSAADAYGRAAAISPLSYDTGYCYALLCAVTENSECFRDASATMLQRFAVSGSSIERHFAIWSCALAPEAVEDYELPIGLAKQIVDMNQQSVPFRVTLGAILYRSGRPAEAIKHLAAVEREHDGPDQAAVTSLAYCCYFLAMAHSTTGDKAEALRYLTKANTWTDAALSEQGSWLAWNRRATLELLRNEATKLIQGPSEARNERHHESSEEPASINH